MLKLEEKVINFFKNNYLILGYIFVTIIAIYMRISVLSFESHDYVAFLSPWFDYLKNNGGFFALASYQGNYNAPYMTIMALLTYIPMNKLYLIKIVSILFDFGLAISSACLVKYLTKDKKNMFFYTYSIVLFLPEVFMNSSLWGQCDSGYTMFIILALLYLFKKKYLVSFIHLGIAFSLKLQFIFILPLFIVLYVVEKRYSILYFLIIPLVNFILCLPAIIIGKPIGELMTIYFGQVSQYKSYMSLNFLNFYDLLNDNGGILYNAGILLTVIICFLMLLYVIINKVKFDNKKMLSLGLWFVMVVTFLLPCMHERYLYVGGILAIIYLLSYKENMVVAISIVVCTLLTYFHYLFGLVIDYKAVFIVAYFYVIVFYTMNVLEGLRSDKK